MRPLKLLLWIVLLMPCLVWSQARPQAPDGLIYVKGYYRKDGTYVSPHYRAKKGTSHGIPRATRIQSPHRQPTIKSGVPRATYRRPTNNPYVTQVPRTIQSRRPAVKKLTTMRVKKLKPVKTPTFRIPKPKKTTGFPFAPKPTRHH